MVRKEDTEDEREEKRERKVSGCQEKRGGGWQRL